jgi:pimeloyl-ACP methyl ester carboxylesterase
MVGDSGAGAPARADRDAERPPPEGARRPPNRIERRELSLHGYRISYLAGGRGPLLVLIHGITNSARSWDPVLELLAERFTVLAPDLLGHGTSAKPRGDYSLGAYASLVRDLMIALDHDRATFVGHSLGGGIAMQLAYQFPERVERLVLVSSGGLGPEVSFLLRAVALPGAEYVLPLLASGPLLDAAGAVSRLVKRLGLEVSSDLAEMGAGFASLHELETRRAFVHTARAVIDTAGQRIDATDRLYLAEAVPTLLIWGDRDPIIPASHGRRAHALMPGSRLEVFEGSGHFPHHHSAVRFVAVLRDFVGGTRPARVDAERMRELVLERGRRDEESSDGA